MEYSERNSRVGLVLLVSLCALGVVFSVLSGLHFMFQGTMTEDRAVPMRAAEQSQFGVENFYRIQKEQLQLRLNELAMQKNLDDQVRDDYNLRIDQYTGETSSLQHEQTRLHAEIGSLESARDMFFRRSRWLLAGAVAFALALLIAILDLVVDNRAVVVFSLLLVLAAVAIVVNSLYVFWK